MDKTSKEHLEELVRERTRELEKMNQELEAFSYSVSHDLRTPLRAIVGFSRILEEEYAEVLDEEGKRLLRVVIDNANMMSDLIDDILAFSRLGRASLAKREVKTQQLFEETYRRLLETFPEYDDSLKVDINDLPVVHADGGMLKQVAENLLSNALKYSQNSEPAVIEVDSYHKGDDVVIYVKDNGAGFDMEYKSKLFGVFQRLHSDDEFEGTGIGLALVKRVINRHDGEIWAEAEQGEGATFYFSLPTQNHNE
ncbi:ATP-binding protein [Aliifodinibius sp. S!AR15-10]|uniref:sensor histidine kinase n=1 Tax=Aliifodinibius sp. S!AR15-10 TaxID=2950437 RepID=UPI00285AF6E8|nr:ATP-binding protein [Aliifodinibius sp. S!AR15-10]MDR8391265.1 ATP-binding protein [Aliifodinibius sp. S!AR15-10]